MVYLQQLYRTAKVFAPFAAKYGYMTMFPSRTNQPLRTARSRTMVMTENKRKRKQGRNSFKNQLYNNLAAKHITGEQGVTMTHNSLFTLTPTAIPTQGDANNSRDGDAIVLCALKLNGFYNTDVVDGPYSFRIIVGFTGEEYANTSFGSGMGLADLFLPSTGTVVTNNGIINPKAFTVLHDEKFTVNSEIDSTRSRVDYSIYVPFNNQKFYYQSAASALGKTKNLVVVVCADVVGGTTGTTAVGGTSISWDFIFKNMS